MTCFTEVMSEKCFFSAAFSGADLDGSALSSLVVVVLVLSDSDAAV